MGGRVLVDGEEAADQRPELGGAELRIGLDPGALLRRGQSVLELLAVDALHGLAEHLDEAPPRVEGKALVLGQSSQALRGLVVEAQVEDGVHHAGHRELGARADADQQGVAWVSETLVRLLLEVRDRGRDLRPESLGQLGLVRVVGAARFGGDGESGRHRHARPRHLGHPGAFAAEEVPHVLRTFRKQVNPLCLRRSRHA